MAGFEGDFHVLDFSGLVDSNADDDDDDVLNDVWPSVLQEPQSEYIKHESEDGQVVLITEATIIDGQRKAHIIVRGTPERLLFGLLDCDLSDPYYIEDFLLTYRVYMPSNLPDVNKLNNAISLINGMDQICSTLLSWFDESILRDQVIKIVLTWINNYDLDFELMAHENCGQKFLDVFEAKLSANTSLSTQIRLLHIALSTKAKVRHITLTRSNRDEEVLHFSILGGYERGYGIFVSKVDPDSKAELLGLKRGDQILEVNGINFTIISHVKALEVLRSTTHLQLTVRYNPFIFKELISLPEGTKSKKFSISSAILPNLYNTLNTPAKSKKVKTQVTPTNSNGGSGTKIKRAIPKFASFISKHLPNVYFESYVLNHSEVDSCPNTEHSSKTLNHRSLSNPSLHSPFPTNFNDPIDQDLPSNIHHVIRVFNAVNGDSRYMLIHEETTAREVVMVSVREFSLCTQSSIGRSSGETGFAKSSLNYALYEVSVVPEANNAIKQRRLSDQVNHLAEKASLVSRYYIKENSNPLLSTSSASSNNSSNDALAVEILKDCPLPINLLSLNSTVLAIELTLHDFNIFRRIEPQSFIFDLFELRSNIDSLDDKWRKDLNTFELLSNKEMFWVINEILNENSVVKRAKIIKYFIKVANICRHLHNYNSLFALLSGLGHGSIQRLKVTWDKLPTKYTKLLKNLQSLMDPSRNMLNYRRELKDCDPPVIPFFPIVKKDLTFIHLAHSTIDEQELVNFDKMRMISKEVRNILNMSSAPYSHGSSYANLLSSHGFTGTSCYTNDYNPRQDIIGGVPLPPPPPVAAPPSSTAVKKLFEESLMRKKVKHYLSQSFANINYDEDALLIKSLELEGGQNGTMSGQANNCNSSRSSLNANSSCKQTHPSPTLSSASSNSSSGRLKFGTESPNQLRKLLSLSEAEYRRSNAKTSILMHHNQFTSGQRNNNNFSRSRNINSTNPSTHTRSISEGSSNSFTHPALPPPPPVPRTGIPLPVESSSVTSLRKMNSRHHHHSHHQAANSVALHHHSSNPLPLPSSTVLHPNSQYNSYNNQNHSQPSLNFRPKPPDYDEALLRKQKLATLTCNTVVHQELPGPVSPNNRLNSVSIVHTNTLKKVPIMQNNLNQDDKVSAV